MTYIVLVNYNGWKDTIECLESLLRLNYSEYKIIVVDNNSTNDSINQLIHWVKGDIIVEYDLTKLMHLSYPPHPKPLSYQYLEFSDTFKKMDYSNCDNPDIIFIHARKNNGFAAGNNIALKYIIENEEAKFIWLLNNDTVVDSLALTNLVNYYNSRENSSKIGIIGAKLMMYSSPDKIQAIGGKYNKWFGTSSHIGGFEIDEGQYDNEDIVRKIDYIIGASMFISIEYIKAVGFMDESYFLYYEDIDWTYRGMNNNYCIGYCWDAKIYHKEGRSIGSSPLAKYKSDLSEYYGLKNRLLFTRLFFPNCLMIVRMSFVVVILNRIFRGQFKKIKQVFKLLLSE